MKKNRKKLSKKNKYNNKQKKNKMTGKYYKRKYFSFLLIQNQNQKKIPLNLHKKTRKNL